MVDKILLEYVWLDGYRTQNLRSKVKVVNKASVGFQTESQGKFNDSLIPTRHYTEGNLDVTSLPVWNFDGSSTEQAPGNMSECLLSPVRTYKVFQDHFIVLCEVMNSDGTPHSSNTRAKLRALSSTADNEQYWWGFEQEFFLTRSNRPLGFPESGYPDPQGMYYCGVGSGNVAGRDLSLSHLRSCLSLGIDITGTNAEVALGQWEYQCFSSDTLKACDDLWVSRYMLYKDSEVYEVGVNLDPKPISGDWNGSGCHTNFSNKRMRDSGGKEYFMTVVDSLRDRHRTHIANYGENNEMRLTGDHETQHIDVFSCGVGDRGASIRIPNSVVENNWTGYLEDRRPASNCDPYTVATLIVETTSKL